MSTRPAWADCLAEQAAKPRLGARTPADLERCRRANWKHGGRSAKAIAGQRLRGEARRLTASLRGLIRAAEDRIAADQAETRKAP
ncbi:hypothetical protein ACFQS7_30140 [Dankookia sp. GCM10030260]|uniref:hypothetical protein n=1 Tax=Dankookia sp. GCM10030260 TaxID=3273390 RepID=UPI0036082103